MPLPISRLRRWFGATAIAVVLVVAGVYFYARHRVQNALKQVPEKIGLEIKQSATGFTVSKSEQGRTLFQDRGQQGGAIQAGGHAELHDVAITLYGRDSSRFDQIYGADFEYDQQSGDVTAQGEVQIDLEANPGGLTNPDQAPPKELKNPIHLKTSGLVFNQKTGNAYTRERVEFRVPQASGSALGMSFVSKTSLLTMETQVNLVISGAAAATITAARGNHHQGSAPGCAHHPLVQSGARRCEADEATLFLRNDNTLDSIRAHGNVLLETPGPGGAEARAEQLELNMTERGGALRTAVFSGDVRAEAHGAQPMQANAGRVTLDFSGKNVLVKVRAEENVKLVQRQNPSGNSAHAQDLQLNAAVVDFFVADGHRLTRAETSGAAQITFVPPRQARASKPWLRRGSLMLISTTRDRSPPSTARPTPAS